MIITLYGPLYSRQVSHQRWIWRSHNRESMQGIHPGFEAQGRHDLCPPQLFFKILYIMSWEILYLKLIVRRENLISFMTKVFEYSGWIFGFQTVLTFGIKCRTRCQLHPDFDWVIQNMTGSTRSVSHVFGYLKIFLFIVDWACDKIYFLC